MNYFLLTTAQQAWKERTAEISARDIGPRAAEYDRTAAFPQASLNALRDAALWSIRVPQKYGWPRAGSGDDLPDRRGSREKVSFDGDVLQDACTWRRWRRSATFRPRTRDNALSSRSCEARCSPPPGGEPHGQTGDDWTPVRQKVSTLPRVAGGFQIDHVRKSYVTSAGHATHYVMFCRVEGGRTEGPPELLMFKHDEVEWETIGAWVVMKWIRPYADRGIRLRRDSWVSVMYAEELNSTTSSVTLQSTDRHGILGQKPAHFQVSLCPRHAECATSGPADWDCQG
jgi:hypothetical protein